MTTVFVVTTAYVDPDGEREADVDVIGVSTTMSGATRMVNEDYKNNHEGNRDVIHLEWYNEHTAQVLYTDPGEEPEDEYEYGLEYSIWEREVEDN